METNPNMNYRLRIIDRPQTTLELATDFDVYNVTVLIHLGLIRKVRIKFDKIELRYVCLLVWYQQTNIRHCPILPKTS